MWSFRQRIDMRTRRDFLSVVGGATLAAGFGTMPAEGAKVKRPNFVFILSDDVNRDCWSVYGNKDCKTPNIERIAAEGMLFENAYCTVAMCAPFRQELYTGRTPWRTGTLANHADKADLFICEALDAKTIHLAAKVASEANQPSLSKIFTDITDYHLTPVQAAEIAQQAGVKKLVFYHVVPPPTNFILKRRYLKGVDDVYGGAVDIGEDGMTFTLEPSG